MIITKKSSPSYRYLLLTGGFISCLCCSIHSNRSTGICARAAEVGVRVDMPQMLTRRGRMREGFTRLRGAGRSEDGQLSADQHVAEEFSRVPERESGERRPAAGAVGRR